MNIVLFGGSFDPIHTGHINIVKECKKNIKDIDEIWFIPIYKSFIKGKLSSYKKRCDMIKFAIKDYNYMKISYLEKEIIVKDKKNFSYTKFLVEKVKEKYANKHHFYFLCGLDSLIEIETWYCYKYLLKNIDFIICNREYNNKFDNINIYINKLEYYKSNYGLNYQLINNKNYDISSTNIRKIISKKSTYDNEVKNILNENVFNYIKENKMYQKKS